MEENFKWDGDFQTREMWWAVFCQNIIPTSGMFPVLVVTRFKT